MANTYSLLSQTIDKLQAQGKTVKVTVLSPASKRNRKSAWCKQAKAPRQKVYA